LYKEKFVYVAHFMAHGREYVLPEHWNKGGFLFEDKKTENFYARLTALLVKTDEKV